MVQRDDRISARDALVEVRGKHKNEEVMSVVICGNIVFYQDKTSRCSYCGAAERGQILFLKISTVAADNKINVSRVVCPDCIVGAFDSLLGPQRRGGADDGI